MNLLEFKKSINPNVLEEARTFIQENHRNGIKVGIGYYFECRTKSGEMIGVGGRTWDDLYNKLPDKIKKLRNQNDNVNKQEDYTI